jgi:hypothetical protein
MQVCSKLRRTFTSFCLGLYSNYLYDAAEFLHQQDYDIHLEVYSVLCLGIKICSCMPCFSRVPSVLDVILIALLTEFFLSCGTRMWEVALKLSHGVGIFVVPWNG